MPVRLAELAVRFGCEVNGDPETLVERVATLSGAGPGALSFLANPRYRRHLAETEAAAVVVSPDMADQCPVPALVTANPYATYARIAQLLHPPAAVEGGRHATAIIEPGVKLNETAWVGAAAYLANGVQVGAGSLIGPGCVLLEGVSIGAGSRLIASVTLGPGVRIGQRCVLHPGVVVGADGFGHAPDGGEYVKVPQIGSVVLGNDVEIGANSTVDRGAIEDTVLEDGVKVDNQVQIGHNVHIGAHTIIAGCVGISGSARIGRHCMIGGMAGIAGHIEICDEVAVTGKTMISASIRKPGVYSGKLPSDDARSFRRNSARFQKLDEMARRLRRLERIEEKRNSEGGDND